MSSLNNNDGFSSNESQHRVLPAYEHVKLNVIFYWFKVQTEFQKYIFLKTQNKQSPFANITSMIFALYVTMLKSSMIKRKKAELIEEMDHYLANDFYIPEEKLIHVLKEFEIFLYDIGYLNTLYESKPWEEQFSNEYPV